jgi:hypothetical protein
MFSQGSLIEYAFSSTPVSTILDVLLYFFCHTVRVYLPVCVAASIPKPVFVRSGTGYLSAIAAVLGGPTSLNHGVEVSRPQRY